MSINTGLCPSAYVLYNKIMDVANDEDAWRLLDIAKNHINTMAHLRNQKIPADTTKEAMRKQEEAFSMALRVFGDRILAEEMARKEVKGREHLGP